jgi:hypothetical protein
VHRATKVLQTARTHNILLGISSLEISTGDNLTVYTVLADSWGAWLLAYISSKFLLFVPSKCSSTTASQSQTKGDPILPQSPHGLIILISSFFQGLKAPYVTKWCLKNRNRSVPSGNQRENKSLHLPAPPQSFTIGILSVIPRKKCRFTCFNGIPRGICWAAIVKVIALARQHREDISSQLGSIQPTQMTLEHPICSKERTSNWVRGKEWVLLGHTAADMKRRHAPTAVA